MTPTSYQATARNSHGTPMSAPSRALLEAAAAHFDGRAQNVPYSVQWDGISLEANARLQGAEHPAQRTRREL